MEYTKEELQEKKIPELKDILKSRNVKSSGNKWELINRILKTEAPKKVEKQQLKGETYFDILPTDITKIITKYRSKIETNNKVAYDILNYLAIRKGSVFPRINKILENLNFPMQIVEKRQEFEGGYYYPYSVEILEDLVINEDVLIDFILILLTKREISHDKINEILKDNNSNLRVIAEDIPGYKNKSKYILGRFLPIKALE